MFRVGEATVTRVEETYVGSYPLREVFKEFTDSHMAEHGGWLARTTMTPGPVGSSWPSIAGSCRSAARKS